MYVCNKSIWQTVWVTRMERMWGEIRACRKKELTHSLLRRLRGRRSWTPPKQPLNPRCRPFLTFPWLLLWLCGGFSTLTTVACTTVAMQSAFTAPLTLQLCVYHVCMYACMCVCVRVFAVDVNLKLENTVCTLHLCLEYA